MFLNWLQVRPAVAAALGTAVSLYCAVVLAQEAPATGEVRRIDSKAGKITIIQGEIPALQLPAMSLVYRIDPVLLKDLKPGDKVHFTVRLENGQYVITRISK